MSRNRRIEPGIYLTPAQRYLVKVADRHGMTSTVSRTVDHLDEARRLARQARDLRAAGRSVREVWAADRVGEARAARRTFEEHARSWLEMRWRLCEASDHTEAANHSDIEGLRPDSFGLDETTIRNHLLPSLGALYTDAIDRSHVRQLSIELARKGLAVSTQERVLSVLRKCLGELPIALRPPEFPWPRVKPIKPSEPLRPPPNPELWGGDSGDIPPATTFAEVLTIASRCRASFRAVVWIMALLGLRRGEAMGLRNSDFSVLEDRVHLRVERQLNLSTNAIKPWVKSRASKRTLIIPDVLIQYLELYWDHYHHGFRPGQEDHARYRHHLVVTSTGRDTDGGFLPATSAPFEKDFQRALEREGYTPSQIGFWMRPHHFRKSLSTYMLRASEIVTSIHQFEAEAELPGPDATAEARREWFATSLRRLRQVGEVIFDGADVSRWLGHETKERRGDGDGTSASPVTLSHYNLPLGDRTAAFKAIADFIDLVVRHEVGTIPFEPDVADTLAVISPNDPKWILVSEVVAATGKKFNTLSVGIRNKTYVGMLAWYADGDRKPPGPRLVMHRDEIARIQKRNAAISRSEAASRLGMSNNYVDRAIREGWVAVIERRNNMVHVDPSTVDELHTRMAKAVCDTLPLNQSISIDRAYKRFVGALEPPTAFDIAIAAVEAGASRRQAARLAGVNENTFASRLRRMQTNDVRSRRETDATVRLIFARPKRVKRQTFDRLIEHAADLGYVKRINHTHIQLRQSGSGSEAAEYKCASLDVGNEALSRPTSGAGSP